MADHSHPVDPNRVAEVRAQGLSRDEASELHALLGVIGEPIRVRVLAALLAVEELCVGDIALALDVTEDAASYALRVLRERGLVERRSEGRMGFYRLAAGPRRELLLDALERLTELAAARKPTASRPVRSTTDVV